jgi:hypothetical protein
MVLDHHRSPLLLVELRAMELLAVVWVVGLILYFSLTTERQRQNNLLVVWILMGAAAILPLIIWLL